MNDKWIDILRTEIEFIYRGGTYKVCVTQETDVEVWALTDDTEYDVGGNTDPTSWYLLDETHHECWVGNLIYFYENDHSDYGPAHTWVEDDYARAADMCQLAGYLIAPRKLEWICGIQPVWNAPCHDYDTAKRYLHLYQEANYNNMAFREGAD